jgi:hypothetical protein
LKKLAVAVVVALVALLAVGSVTAVAGKKKVIKVKTTVSISFNPGSGDYYEQASFNGRVKAKKRGVCKKKRKVKIVNKDDGDVVGKAVSKNNGNYKTGVDNSFVPGDRYYAKVKRAVIEKKKKKIVCKKAKSNAILGE